MSILNDKELITHSLFEVTAAETDMEARLRLGAHVNILIQSAIKSADSLGFGYNDIQQQQLFWVLSRLTLEISRPVRWYEKLEVETWPKNVEKILYLRDFIVRDNDRQTVVKASSAWLAVDLKTKRPKKIDGIHAGLFIHLKNKHALQYLPDKISTAGEGDEFNFHPAYFDFDLNKHLTSTRYVDYMMDTFDQEFHQTHYPCKLSVNYIKETMPGETLSFRRQQVDKNKFIFEGTSLESKVIKFRGEVSFNL